MKSRRSLFGSSAADEWGTRARRTPETELDITPMIDVTFLLLIFFMVTSTMQAPDLNVPSADHGVGIEGRSAFVVYVQEESPEPVINLENVKNISLDELRVAVEEAVRANRREVIIRADGQLPHGFVQQVTRAVAEVEGAEFSIGVRDKAQQ